MRVALALGIGALAAWAPVAYACTDAGASYACLDAGVTAWIRCDTVADCPSGMSCQFTGVCTCGGCSFGEETTAAGGTRCAPPVEPDAGPSCQSLWVCPGEESMAQWLPYTCVGTDAGPVGPMDAGRGMDAGPRIDAGADAGVASTSGGGGCSASPAGSGEVGALALVLVLLAQRARRRRREPALRGSAAEQGVEQRHALRDDGGVVLDRAHA